MSRTSNEITLVCYDITSDKLRSKIDKCMKDFGVRLQYSLYLCRMDARSATRCRENLRKVLKQHDSEREPSDSLIIFDQVRPDVAVSLVGTRLDAESTLYGVF